MEFYTVVLRQSAGYWVALCLENGLVGQGENQDGAIAKLKEAIESFQEIYQAEADIYSAAVSIKELHEFLSVEAKEPTSEVYELRAVYA
ncbi:type II toxin-antitoxin system HicB family antitoxin [Microcoleus sp. FACHB-1515]|uniref:type II toxin-antitoxin system HicB family antitoxin n=1 Tax=Cyanophyceae TaxID=3028117 RepID=UPI001685F416|nr:type II toxin-antitoxin system HicB family antitoxin [Microcoleus sp. FACHB-1515]MBD2089480.1 type II toxin-antitoxin system HicB family antitoxin [Microcoleus sp. FACHB-1515]